MVPVAKTTPIQSSGPSLPQTWIASAHLLSTTVVLEVQSTPGQPIPELIWMSKGVRLGAVRSADSNSQIASLFVPDAAKEFFEEELTSYTREETALGNIPQREKFETLGVIRQANVESLWTDRRPITGEAQEPLWWECWTWSDQVDELRSIGSSDSLVPQARDTTRAC